MDDRVSRPWRMRGLHMAAAAAMLCACGGGDVTIFVSSGTGGTTLFVSSASCAFIRVEVQIDEIRIARAGAAELTTTLPQPRPIDLLDPGTGILQALQAAPLVEDASDVSLRVAGEGKVRFEDGTVAALTVPANLRLVGDFRLAAGMAADLVIVGFDRCGAIRATGPSGGLVLTGDVPAMVRALS